PWMAPSVAQSYAAPTPIASATARRAHQVVALVYANGAHATPHQPIELASLGADLIATSAYKWGGPHVGAVVGTPAALDRLSLGDPAEAADRLELGSLPLELLAGVGAAGDALAGVGGRGGGGRRARRVAA